MISYQFTKYRIILCGPKNKLLKGVLYKWKYGKSCYCTNESTENHVIYKVFNNYTEILPTDDSCCLELWTFLRRAAASCPTCPKSMRKKSSDLPDSYNLWFFVKHENSCTVYIKMVHLNIVTNSVCNIPLYLLSCLVTICIYKCLLFKFDLHIFELNNIWTVQLGIMWTYGPKWSYMLDYVLIKANWFIARVGGYFCPPLNSCGL